MIISKSITPSTTLCDKYVCHKCIGVINQAASDKLTVINMPLKTKLDKNRGKFEGYIGVWRNKLNSESF